MSFANNMTNSPGGISRVWCETCKTETLHKGAACGTCGTIHRAYPVRDLAKMLRGSINHPSLPKKRK